MKKLIIAGCSLVASTVIAASQSTVTLAFSWLPDNTQMAGLSTNDYCTNIFVVFYSTKNVNQPTNQWPVVSFTPMINLLSQGAPGTIWTNQLTMDGNSRFYSLTMTNGNGGASPFSNVAPGLISPLAGVLYNPKVGP